MLGFKVVAQQYIKLVKEMYNGVKTSVLTSSMSNKFLIMVDCIRDLPWPVPPYVSFGCTDVRYSKRKTMVNAIWGGCSFSWPD